MGNPPQVSSLQAELDQTLGANEELRLDSQSARETLEATIAMLKGQLDGSERAVEALSSTIEALQVGGLTDCCVWSAASFTKCWLPCFSLCIPGLESVRPLHGTQAEAEAARAAAASAEEEADAAKARAKALSEELLAAKEEVQRGGGAAGGAAKGAAAELAGLAQRNAELEAEVARLEELVEHQV